MNGNFGWVCCNCNYSYAPFVVECLNCNRPDHEKYSTSTTLTATYKQPDLCLGDKVLVTSPNIPSDYELIAIVVSINGERIGIKDITNDSLAVVLKSQLQKIG